MPESEDDAAAAKQQRDKEIALATAQLRVGGAAAAEVDQDAELERLLALGARPVDVGQTGEEPWHVLVDPEGNEFCLLRSRVAPL